MEQSSVPRVRRAREMKESCPDTLTGMGKSSHSTGTCLPCPGDYKKSSWLPEMTMLDGGTGTWLSDSMHLPFLVPLSRRFPQSQLVPFIMQSSVQVSGPFLSILFSHQHTVTLTPLSYLELLASLAFVGLMLVVSAPSHVCKVWGNRNLSVWFNFWICCAAFVK
jgi:hypothetical protein